MASPKKKLATAPGNNNSQTEPEVLARMAKNALRPSLTPDSYNLTR